MKLFTSVLSRLAYAGVQLGRRWDGERLLRVIEKNGNRPTLRWPVTIYHPERLVAGSDVHIGEYVHIRAGGGLRLGDRVAIAAHAVLTTQGHPVDLPRFNRRSPIVTNQPITIGDDVWIGSGAIVLPGITIGRGAVVAAGAVVTRDVPELTVVAGVPARFVRNVGGDT